MKKHEQITKKDLFFLSLMALGGFGTAIGAYLFAYVAFTYL